MNQKLKIIIALSVIVIIAIGFSMAVSGGIDPYQHQFNTGYEYLKGGYYENAIIAFDKALELKPKSMEAQMGKGEAYINLKNYEKAEMMFKKAIDIDNKYSQAYDKLLEVYQKANLTVKINNLYKWANRNGAKLTKDIRPNPPTSSIASGTYGEKKQIVLKAANGYSIYYTTDGKEPALDSSKYEKPINLESGNNTIKCISISNNIQSSVSIYNYNIQTPELTGIKWHTMPKYDFEDINSVSNSDALIAKKQKKYGIVKTDGVIVQPFKYDKMYYCSRCKVIFTDNPKFAFDKTGKKAMTHDGHGGDSTHRWDVDKKRLYYAYDLGDLELVAEEYWPVVVIGIKNVGKGNFPIEYDYILDSSNNFKYGVANGKKLIIPVVYESIEDESEGLYAAKKDGKAGFLDSNGNIAIPFVFEETRSFNNGVAAVKKDGLWGFIYKPEDKILDLLLDNYWNNNGVTLGTIAQYKFFGNGEYEKYSINDNGFAVKGVYKLENDILIFEDGYKMKYDRSENAFISLTIGYWMVDDDYYKLYPSKEKRGPIIFE